MAARRPVCVFGEMDATRSAGVRFALACLWLALLLGLHPAKSFAENSHIEDAANGPKGAYLFHASLNETTLDENIEDFARLAPQGQNPGQQNQGFIERIDFEGNRRIRKDTLQARIFSRQG